MPGGIFSRPKPVRRAQRRSGELDDGLEGRTPDDEAPARPDHLRPASPAEIHAHSTHGLDFLGLTLHNLDLVDI